MPDVDRPARIKVQPNGPYLVSGAVPVTAARSSPPMRGSRRGRGPRLSLELATSSPCAAAVAHPTNRSATAPTPWGTSTVRRPHRPPPMTNGPNRTRAPE